MSAAQIPVSILLYGDSGAGKSRLASTAPGPRLILDAEGGTRFIPGRKIAWDPMVGGPPAADGTWDTCTVYLRDWHTMKQVYQWLNSGKHEFVSVIIDSITELQKRAVDFIAGPEQMTQNQWGVLLRDLELQIRQLRDLTFHATKPLTCVILIALATSRDNKTRPLMQGQIGKSLPAFVDVVGYLYTELQADGAVARLLLVNSTGMYEAKDRTDALINCYGNVVPSPNITTMQQQITDYYSSAAQQ